MTLINCIYEKNTKIIKNIGNDFVYDKNKIYYRNNFIVFEPNLASEVIDIENTEFIFKKDWYYITNLKKIELTECGSIQFKNLLLDQLAENRYNKETSGYSYKNKLFYTDRETQTKYNAVYTAARDNLITELDWKTMDGTFIKLNQQEAVELSLSVLAYVQYLFTQESIIQNMINNSLTLNELLNIQIDFS